MGLRAAVCSVEQRQHHMKLGGAKSEDQEIRTELVDMQAASEMQPAYPHKIHHQGLGVETKPPWVEGSTSSQKPLLL